MDLSVPFAAKFRGVVQKATKGPVFGRAKATHLREDCLEKRDERGNLIVGGFMVFHMSLFPSVLEVCQSVVEKQPSRSRVGSEIERHEMPKRMTWTLSL